MGENMKMDVQEVEWGHGLICSGLGQGQVEGACVCCNGPSGSIKCREYLY